MIETLQQATVKAASVFSSAQLKGFENTIVDANGNVYANCNINDTVKGLDSKEVKYFILKGEVTQKKKKKNESQ